MSKIQKILLEAIGEDKEVPLGLTTEEDEEVEAFNSVYNLALDKLRAKIPEIEKKILDEFEKEFLEVQKCYLMTHRVGDPSKIIIEPKFFITLVINNLTS